MCKECYDDDLRSNEGLAEWQQEDQPMQDFKGNLESEN